MRAIERSIRKSLFVLGVAAWWLFRLDVPAQAVDITVDEMQRLASPLVDSGRIAGLSLGVIHGERELKLHLGHRDPVGQVANDATIYEIGSITKVFTATLLASLIDHGVIGLEDPAFSDESKLKVPAKVGSRVTWKHLATHRSGFPRLAGNMRDVSGRDPYARETSDRVAIFLRSLNLKRDPGRAYAYSNLGFAVLGYRVGEVAGKSYEDLLLERVTGPLGMRDTRVNLNDEQENRFATPFAGGKPVSSWTFADMPGAGGIRSTLPDMMRFARAALNPPDNPTGNAIELTFQKHQTGGPRGFSMGLGWHLARDLQTRWHNGETGGFHSALFVNRSMKAGVVILANSSNGSVVDVLAEQLMQTMAGRKMKPQEFDREIQVPLENKRRLIGRYQLVENFVFDVHLRGDEVWVGITNQPTQQVFAKSQAEWFYRSVDATLVFELGETGKTSALVLHQNGLKQRAEYIGKSLLQSDH
ncbi:MAG: serine hydrolase [Planctomycetota bacterium]